MLRIGNSNCNDSFQHDFMLSFYIKWHFSRLISFTRLTFWLADDGYHGTYRFCLLDNMAIVGGRVGAHILPSASALRHDVSVQFLHQQQLRHSLLPVLLVPAEHGNITSPLSLLLLP